jgi:PilZ domain-containing protein
MKRAIAERREASRDPYTVDVTVTVISALGDEMPFPRCVLGRTVNLSKTGICVITEEPLDRAGLALCKIALPFTQASVPTLMQVRWIRKRASELNEYLVGLQFLL